MPGAIRRAGGRSLREEVELVAEVAVAKKAGYVEEDLERHGTEEHGFRKRGKLLAYTGCRGWAVAVHQILPRVE